MDKIRWWRGWGWVAGCWIAASAHGADFGVVSTHPVGGDGGWDYVSYDAASDRLYIARSTRVQVVDATSGLLVAEIPDTPGVHGVALAADRDKGYASNGRDRSVTVFAMSTSKTLTKIATPLGANPDFIAYDAATGRVVAFNGQSSNVSVIDAATDRLVATIALSGKPEAAVVDGKGLMYVNIEDRNALTAIDLRAGVALATWPLQGCDEPAALAIDTQGGRLFVGCHNLTALVVQASDGAVLARLPIGAGVDAAGFDPLTRLAFTSQGDGTLTVIAQDSTAAYVVAQTVKTAPGARTMALDPKNHRVFLVTADFEEAAAASGSGRARRTVTPNTFRVLGVAARPTR